MEYRELEDVYEFHRNMRREPWTQLFPHWWDDTDALLTAIGNEVERIKAISVFSLLNAGIKPPVLLWQESINHKEYHVNANATSLPYSVSVQAPLYKTWGKITLSNNTPKDLDGLIIKLDENHGYVINQLISQSDEIVIDLTANKVFLNNKAIDAQKIGQGLPYFITQQNKEKYDENTPLHNEVVRVTIETHRDEEIECDIDIDIQLDNVVFTNEQNMEITGLEAVPIERVELYAEYDFPFNKQYNGWHKVYDKKYDSNTNVVYDMITTQIYTKKFYVDVYFKTLQFPYRVGFPCYKDAEEGSPYHVNTNIDTWGTQLGLDRRTYKTNIPEDEYYRTYPIFYPFDIEQDYWYYRRLTSEYAWNDLAVNDVELLDTNNDAIVRLYAVDPFMEDLVIHAKSKYPTDKEFVNYNQYYPTVVQQKNTEGVGRQTPYTEIINLLSNNEKRASITLNNKTDNNDVIYKRTNHYKKYKEELIERYNNKDSTLTEAEKNILKANPTNTLSEEEIQDILESSTRDVNYIKSSTHQSTELLTYFDLSTLPEDVNIDNIEVIVKGDSNNNTSIDDTTNRYSTEGTGILIPNYKGQDETFIELTPDSPYQLRKQLITYSNNQIQDKLSEIEIDDYNIVQSYKIGEFEGEIQGFVKIPFELKENNENVTDITEVWIYYNDTVRKASYHNENGEQYIRAYVPNVTIMNKITIICKSKTHYPFMCDIDISKGNKYDEETGKLLYQCISGPFVDGIVEEYADSVEWRTNDIRNLIQKQGIYFRHIIKNNNEQSSSTIHLYNIAIKVTYSPKKANFLMSTYIDRENVKLPYIGTYHLTMSNIGDKPLKTHVDILTPPNIKLETNHIDVDLKPNKTFSFKNPNDDELEGIRIIPNYPIDDGFYDIVTICEDKIKTNTIEVFSDGLIEAPINIAQHSCRYNKETTLTATIKPIDGSIIKDINVDVVEFYVNGYSVGKTTIQNNKATLSIIPSDFNFITSGNLSLEAKFLGTTKYAPSSKRASIFIKKESTRVTLMTNEFAPYKGSFTLKAKVEYYNGTEYLPVDDGVLEFYVNDEIISSNSKLNNGIFTAFIQKIENPSGNYTLYAKYTGSNMYAANEASQPFKIIGGDVKIAVFNIEAKPKDSIKLKAQVVDRNKYNVINTYIDFYIKDKDGNYVDFNIPNFSELTKNIEIQDGIAVSEDIQLDEKLDSDLNNHRYIIEARYHYNIEDDATDMSLYQVSDPNGYLIIAKGDVVLQHPSIFHGTQYEPLGFSVSVLDASTNKPVLDGNVQLTLKNENMTPLISSIDEDGVARFLYQPLEFSAKEWNELEKFSFDVIEEDLYKTYNSDVKNIYVDFFYNTEDGTLHYIGNKLNEDIDLSAITFNSETGKYYINNNALLDRDVSEHIYITDGYLYARTTKDALRQYSLGLQDIEFKYISNGQYKDKTDYMENGLSINISNVDLDIHSYDLTYNSNDVITCYATKYNLNDNGVYNNINDGDVLFIIDDEVIDTIDIQQGRAVLSNRFLSGISAGNHLMQVRYVSKDNQSVTYSYSLLHIDKSQPHIYIDTGRKISNKSTNIDVIFNVELNNRTPLTGIVNLYLNDELVGNQFLNGIEHLPGIVDPVSDIPVDNTQIKATFNLVIPEDFRTSEYQLTASYEGNEFFLPAYTEEPYILNSGEKNPVNIDIQRDIYVALNETCIVDAFLLCEDDTIDEGEIVLQYGNTEVTSSNVLNNKARLSWQVTDKTNASYNIVYRNSDNYSAEPITINVHVIEPLDEIYVPRDCPNIENALMCLKDNGTIYITDDIILTQSLEINKDCNIIGENGTSLIKDVTDLLTDNITIYSTEDVEDMSVIQGLSHVNLNTSDFRCIDGQLYIKTKSTPIPIYLAEDGLFYSDSKIQLKDILSDVNLIINSNVEIDNLIFKSNDTNSIADFVIYNQGKCLITHSIIESTAKIYNKGELTANRNLIYGLCQGQANLDNNWWGSNTAPYNVNNHMIIKVSTKNTPAVISEETQVIGELIGANGQYYDMPQVDFVFTADTGYFSIDSGSLTNNKITTTYLDAEKEGNIYFTVDKETVQCPIYNYENKTEVIFDEIEEVLINRQLMIVAKVQSCADTYYEFNKDNTVRKSTQPINEGFLTFYISKEDEERQQVGYTRVINGEGVATVFFTDLIYNIGEEYIIEAEYHTDGEYFDSSSSMTVKIINEDNICFVSTSGSDSSEGTYSSPFATISKALKTNKDKIYLLSGSYSASNLIIDKNVTIKGYGDVVFQNLQGTNLFTIPTNTIVNIINIDFISNDFSSMITNSGNLYMEKCIFYQNKGVLFENHSRFNIALSAIVENNNISNNIDSNSYSKCWFGTNSPDNTFNNYIIMKYEQSKDIIYIGSLVHITATLKHYINNGQEYELEEEIPLRIAKFATEVGSTKPIKDYTYHNQSTSLINTLEDNNNNQYIITLENNTYYYNNNINLRCYVKDVYGNNAEKDNDNILQVHIQSDTNDLSYNIGINNGIAECSIPPLPMGRYTINCTYINQQVYTLSTYFDVKPLDIVIKDLNIDNNSHLYYTQINAQVQDNFGNNINNQRVNIKIDNTFIRSTVITDGELNVKLQYDLLEPGKHELLIDNDDIITSYDRLCYKESFISRAQKTTISFDYDTFEANIYNTLIVEINDEEFREVQKGYIDVIIDDKTFGDHISVSNGVAIIKGLKFTEIGQHSIIIDYKDNEGYYKDTSFVKSDLGVGIFPVVCSISNNDILYADIGKIFTKEITVQDKGYQRVEEGIINIYLDGGIFSENNKVTKGLVTISKKLPDGISAGTHRLTIEYSGSDNYLDTVIDAFLMINKITTEISVNPVSGASGQYTKATYNINSIYGAVNIGKVSAFLNYNNEETLLATDIVNDSIINQIDLSLPLIPAGDNYTLLFKYHDDEENYADSEDSPKLIIEKSKVNIKMLKTSYYPQKYFNLGIDITDKENKTVDEGYIDVYIDNIKEYSDIRVINGQATIPNVILNNARNYNFKIIFKENDYYAETEYSQLFSVTNIEIDTDNVVFKYPLESLPNVAFINEILFNTEDYIIKDGTVDLLFDGNLVGTYYMAENNHIINFNIGQEIKGSHELTIHYYGSKLFKDFDKTFDFTILSKTTNLRLNRNGINSQDIRVSSSDAISIFSSFGHIENNEWVSTPITGIVKYYLLIPHTNTNEEYYERFIGLEEFDNVSSNDTPFKYILTTDLLTYIQYTAENQFQIKAHFIGNDEYGEVTEFINLSVYRQTVYIQLPEENIFEYQSKIVVPIDIIDSNNQYIVGKEIVNVFINNKLVGSCDVIDGQGIFEYKLNSKYTVGSYNLTIDFNGSAVNKETSVSTNFIIQAVTPHLKTTEINVYPGASYWLDGVIYDNDNVAINEGKIKYTYSFFDNSVRQSAPNKKEGFQFPSNITENSQIKVEYISNDLTRYNNFTDYITVNVHKNPITLSIYAPDYVYRKTPFDITIKAESPNTNIPVDLTFTSENDNNIKMINGTVTVSTTYSSLEDSYIDTFTTEGSDVFEGGSINLKIFFKNYDYITVDPESPETATNTHTLNQAINLVSDYGTIEVINSISNETITLDKSVTIKGNAELINCSITNLDKKLTIDGITFTSNKAMTDRYIHNESILETTNCTFTKAPAGAIYTDGSASIVDCIFQDNNSDKGACIYIANKNYKTSITGCQFNRNNASLYGGCIYSYKVNDIEILNNEFTDNNNALLGGSCIYGYGNITISSNSFYGNIGKNQINLLRGNFAIDKNLFEKAYVNDEGQQWNTPIYPQQDPEIDADFNYWGSNNLDEIKTYTNGITINNYLIGDYTISDDNQHITYTIDKYINSLEKEITTINTLEKTFIKRKED